MTPQAPELLPCRAKRDDLGYHCRECGASWIGKQDPPDCLRNQIAKTILKKFLGVDDFEKTTEGWDTGCIELADEILALARPTPAERPDPQVREALKEAIAVFESWHDDETEIEFLPRLRAALTARRSDAAVAWTNEAQLGFLRDPNYSKIPMAMWADRGFIDDIPLYALPPDEPARVTPPTVGVDDLARQLCVINAVDPDCLLYNEHDDCDEPTFYRWRPQARALLERYSIQSPTIASEKEPVQATSVASERVCDHPVTEKAVTADDLWMAIRERDAKINAVFAALKTEEKYLHDTKDESDLMHGDIEGAFHRLRQTFYTSNSSDPVIANPANLLRSQPEIECRRAVTGIEAADIVWEYLRLTLNDATEGDAANIIHILHTHGVSFTAPEPASEKECGNWIDQNYQIDRYGVALMMIREGCADPSGLARRILAEFTAPPAASLIAKEEKEFAKIKHRGVFIERQLQGDGKYLYICHTGICKFLPDLFDTQDAAIKAVDAALIAKGEGE